MWYVSTSAAYTFYNNVRLDRPSYYTDGQLFLTNDVAMPNVADFSATVGVSARPVGNPGLGCATALGGGDIRRQDMPFVSNRVERNEFGGLRVERGDA